MVEAIPKIASSYTYSMNNRSQKEIQMISDEVDKFKAIRNMKYVHSKG